MDVERTVEFILQQQAKAEVQMEAIRKLIRVGMRMIAKQSEQIAQTTEAIRELSAAQQKAQQNTDAQIQHLHSIQQVTEVKLQGLIDALRRGGNGHQSS